MPDYSACYKPPLTHLVDDAPVGGGAPTKTLCGIPVGEEWQVNWDSVEKNYILENIACGCSRCGAIARARVLKEGQGDAGT